MDRSSADCQPTELIVGRRSADEQPNDDSHKPSTHIFIAFLYTYLDIFAFSSFLGGKRLSTNHQCHHFIQDAHNGICLSNASADSRPIVARLIVCCPTSKYCRSMVDRSSDDGRPIKNLAVDKGYRRGMFKCNCSSGLTKTVFCMFICRQSAN